MRDEDLFGSDLEIEGRAERFIDGGDEGAGVDSGGNHEMDPDDLPRRANLDARQSDAGQ